MKECDNIDIDDENDWKVGRKQFYIYLNLYKNNIYNFFLRLSLFGIFTFKL